MAVYSIDLSARYGQQAVKHLATAYEAVLLSLSLGRMDRIPDRPTRVAIMEAMLAEGTVSQFCTDKMREAGAAVAATSTI